jgi:hypothetical protein
MTEEQVTVSPAIARSIAHLISQLVHEHPDLRGCTIDLTITITRRKRPTCRPSTLTPK